MPITRVDLIKKCDQFMAGIISVKDIEEFAFKLILDDENQWEEDEVISQVIYAWDTAEINYPITHTNVSLWKELLESGRDRLAEFNIWDFHIENQKLVCERYDVAWSPISKNSIIGCSEDLNDEPLHGERHSRDGKTTGWYIWSGKYSEQQDFFNPICAKDLLQRKPEVVKYLGLSAGFRFLLGKDGYEDVWHDKKLL